MNQESDLQSGLSSNLKRQEILGKFHFFHNLDIYTFLSLLL